jgi:hypothetical protein
MISNWMIGKAKRANERSIDYDTWRIWLDKEFNHLKNAPIDEYFSRILDIATQMKDNWIKF